MVKDIQQASRQLNKRQTTWFRDDPMYQWLDAKQPIDTLVQQILQAVEQSEHFGMFLPSKSLYALCMHAISSLQAAWLLEQKLLCVYRNKWLCNVWHTSVKWVADIVTVNMLAVSNCTRVGQIVVGRLIVEQDSNDS